MTQTTPQLKQVGLIFILIFMAVCAWLFMPNALIQVASTPIKIDATAIEKGRYLAVLGNCQSCHTVAGGAAFAGGRGIDTPFGTVFSSNLTPSAHGLRAWTADDFWRALHHGQSRDGRWLYPAFPYNNTTHIERADSDALWAFFSSLAPVEQAPKPHQVDWPFHTPAALKVWRSLYFEPGIPPPESPPSIVALSADAMAVRRGAYLVQSLGHCSACHAPRNALGANRNMLDLAGGLIPVQNWYAPSLTDPAEAGLQDWTVADIVRLFKTGRARDAQVLGPMSEVVQHSTQHWQDSDLQAMALYLKRLPRTTTSGIHARRTAHSNTNGARLYEQHCAQCHGPQGEGTRLPNGDFAYLPLSGNRSLGLSSPANLIQTVLHGGFGPSTADHTQPFGMQPFLFTLSDEQIAAVLTHLRSQQPQALPAVSALEVQELRGTGGR
jgi:mono/diheme cytochrome c family protein